MNEAWVPTPEEVAALRRTLEQQAARIAELEAQLAQRWQPVAANFILTHDTGLVDTPKQFVRWNADDESVLVGKDDGSFYHCPLPDNIRLCRLVTQEPTLAIPPDVRKGLQLAVAFTKTVLDTEQIAWVDSAYAWLDQQEPTP